MSQKSADKCAEFPGAAVTLLRDRRLEDWGEAREQFRKLINVQCFTAEQALLAGISFGILKEHIAEDDFQKIVSFLVDMVLNEGGTSPKEVTH